MSTMTIDVTYTETTVTTCILTTEIDLKDFNEWSNGGRVNVQRIQEYLEADLEPTWMDGRFSDVVARTEPEVEIERVTMVLPE